jgi:tetratricopeptide (TPR) repeat protein
MEQRPLEYTVKIYCEGFTEWYYFEWLRTNNRFKFSMEPDIPKNSRSSYKQNLKLIDKELRKNPQERADAIFLVIDTDTLVKNKAQYAIYQEAKEKYKKQGVIFIESHPCIEIWFLYHLMDKFARTNFETYEALRPAIENVLPKYEKTARYYQKNSLFRESILKSQTNREKAIDFSIKACKYEPIENEIANYTEVFKAIHFFRLLQKFAEIRLLLAEKLRTNVAIQPNVASHKSLAIMHNEDMICTLKYSGTILKCILGDG